MNKFAITAASAIANSVLLAVSVSANAQSVTETVKVRIYPYELASIEGRASALDRIERAAARLCAPEGVFYSHAERNSCEERTTEQMVHQAQSPALYAMWTRKGGIETASRN